MNFKHLSTIEEYTIELPIEKSFRLGKEEEYSLL
jgi:hypothetical protein